MRLVINDRKDIAEGIVRIELTRPDLGSLPAAEAGSHIDLSMSNGLVRSYSLINAPGDDKRYVIAVHKAPDSRGGSRLVHDSLWPGTQVEVKGPRNHFGLVDDEKPVVLIAGGVGITPLWCMVQQLESQRRPWQLFYGAKSRRHAAFLDDLEALERETSGRVHLHFADEAGAFLDVKGIVQGSAVATHLYCCGPAGMLDVYEKATVGRPSGNIHLERFSAEQEGATTGGFDLVLARSGRTLKVLPGKRILDCLIDAGIEVTHSCREGVCGACETRVVEGRPDHRDAYLTPHQKAGDKTIMVCCSGSLDERLVLDL